MAVIEPMKANNDFVMVKYGKNSDANNTKNPAPVLSPNIPGDDKEFFNATCKRYPETDKPAPQIIAAKDLGNLIEYIIVFDFISPVLNKASIASFTFIACVPITREAIKTIENVIIPIINNNAILRYL